MSKGKDGLTLKQQMFVEEYLVDFNATGAARRAGYSKKTAHDIGCENLTKPKIQQAINKAVRARSKRTEITQDRVLEELARLAFFDVRKLYNEEGEFLAIHELPDDVAAAIGGLDVTSVGGDSLVTTKKVKVIDKKGALEMLGKHLKMFTEKVHLSGGVTVTNSSDEELENIAQGKK